MNLTPMLAFGSTGRNNVQLLQTHGRVEAVGEVMVGLNFLVFCRRSATVTCYRLLNIKFVR